MVIPKRYYAEILDFQGINLDYQDLLQRLLATQSLTYAPRTAAETDSNLKQFVTYTIIQQKDRILSFRRGQYNRAAAFLRGARCIGFGGHVTEDDLNIFTFNDKGIKANAARELSEEIRLMSGHPEIDPDELELLGFINDDSSDVGVRHVAAVLRFWAPENDNWKIVQRGEASITRLAWLKTTGAEIDLLEFEYWSQLCLRTFFPSFVASRPSYKIIKHSAFRGQYILCVLGSIGSGKSITTNRLCARAAFQEINTGKVVANLLGIPPVPDTPRDEFQLKAFEMISEPGGPRRLAQAILDEVASLNVPKIIIDGVRQLETLEALRGLSSRKISCIFVYTPPDIAYRLYSIREANKAKLSVSDFMRIYNAPVESEVRLMIRDADAIIYNWLGLENYEFVVEKFATELEL